MIIERKGVDLFLTTVENFIKDDCYIINVARVSKICKTNINNVRTNYMTTLKRRLHKDYTAIIRNGNIIIVNIAVK